MAESSTNRLPSWRSRESPRSTMKREHGDDDEADDQAELLAGDGENEIGMRIGQVRP